MIVEVRKINGKYYSQEDFWQTDDVSGDEWDNAKNEIYYRVGEKVVKTKEAAIKLEDKLYPDLKTIRECLNKVVILGKKHPEHEFAAAACAFAEIILEGDVRAGMIDGLRDWISSWCY